MKNYKFVFFKQNIKGETIEGKVTPCKNHKEAKKMFDNQKAFLLERKIKLKKFESMTIYVEREDECFEYFEYQETRI